ncbi:MAG: divalent metal cation transporter [Planctomycetaceae bacterium]
MSSTPPQPQPPFLARLASRIGPGLITACVVIGPGSVFTSSKAGASLGYPAAIIVLCSALLMNVYMTLAARLGVVTQRSTASLVTEQFGRWLAVLIGVAVCVIATIFQTGNNLAVISAVEVIASQAAATEAATPASPVSDANGVTELASLIAIAALVLLNLLAVVFLFAFKNFYHALERLMMGFVAVMLLAFAANLAFAIWQGGSTDTQPAGNWLDISTIGLIGTTFISAAAYYQSYLVRFRGWRREQLDSGLFDARVGSAIMGLITLMVLATAATSLRGKTLASPQDYAMQLRPLFGAAGVWVFFLGLLSAAYSSFLVNSMIGGFLLADGAGLGDRPTDRWPQRFTAGVLITGAAAASVLAQQGISLNSAIIAAQALTVLFAPLMAGVIWWLTAREQVMGNDRNGPMLNLGAAIGFVVLLVLSGYLLLTRVWPALNAAP